MMVPRSRSTRAAFSMIEVMIALTILAAAISAILGNYHVLNSVRTDTASRGTVSEVGRAILDRIVSSDLRALGDPSPPPEVVRQPWSLPRHEDLPTLRPPLTMNASNPDDDLVGQGLISSNLVITDLRVFIEYYRGMEVRDNVTNTVLLHGVLSGNFTARGEFRKAFVDPTWRADRRLEPTIAPMGQVEEGDPIVIRILMAWGDNQRLEFFTIKHRPPGG